MTQVKLDLRLSPVLQKLAHLSWAQRAIYARSNATRAVPHPVDTSMTFVMIASTA